MKFSELWLREWVNPAIDSDALANQITMAGLEVDGVEPVAGSFHGVVVGEVVECAQHPNADKLRVTKVNVGGDRLLDIVCGAPNCRQGLRVAVATIGAVLPGDFKIKAAKLRGEPSEGMLCSFSELGISDDHSGIIELPADAPIGTDIREYLKLDDNTIEISVTPNRADCLGIIGVARDVAVLNQLPLVFKNYIKTDMDISTIAKLVVSFLKLDSSNIILAQTPVFMGVPNVGKTDTFAGYSCVVPDAGNPLAQAAMADVFRLDGDSEWRGLGVIESSGVHLTPDYQRFDAEAHFRPAPQQVCDDPRARCGEVLTGKCKPHQCPLFGNTCNPQTAFGALMVSSEGACAAWYQYRQQESEA
jgi:tRNA-binding EMAP/Myf-like protein